MDYSNNSFRCNMLSGMENKTTNNTKKREKRPRDEITDLSDLGDILQEIKPEIIRNLKLNEEQTKILETWINTIDKVTKSKLSKWLIDKVGGMM